MLDEDEVVVQAYAFWLRITRLPSLGASRKSQGEHLCKDLCHQVDEAYKPVVVQHARVRAFWQQGDQCLVEFGEFATSHLVELLEDVNKVLAYRVPAGSHKFSGEAARPGRLPRK